MRTRLGEFHSDLITEYDNLAEMYLKQGSAQQAEALLRQTLRVKINLHGEMAFRVAVAYWNLAMLHYIGAA